MFEKVEKGEKIHDWTWEFLIEKSSHQKIDGAHKAYQEKLFDSNPDSSHKNIWRCVKRLCKDKTGVPPLCCNESTLHRSIDKAEVINNQFHTVFTRENLSNLPQQQNSPYDGPYPTIHTTSFSVEGILQLLNSLDINKASGPDNIPGRVLKICAPEIAPILAIIFTRSYESGKLPNDWLLANITPVFKNVTCTLLLPYPAHVILLNTCV